VFHFIFKTVKPLNAEEVSVKKPIIKIEEYVKQKETLLSTTDVILAKYSKENL